MSDLTFICADCQQEFVWTEGEQEFYRSKSLPAPTLCLICRARRQAQNRDHAKYQKPEHSPNY